MGHGAGSTIYDMAFEGFVNPLSSGAIYRRSVFDRVGLYDESFDACEDVEFNYRVWQAQLRSYSSPLLAVRYSPRDTIGGLFKQMMRYGRGRLRLMHKHSEASSVAQLVPAVFIFVLVVLLIATLWVPIASRVLLLLVSIYAAAVVAVSSGLALRKGPRYFFVCPVVFAAIHFGLGIGFCLEACNIWRLRRRDAILVPPITANGPPPGSSSDSEMEIMAKLK